MTLFENALLAIVEGITEYLPVSSTGHLMMVSEGLNLHGQQMDTYIVSIQFGAIFSVVLLYWKRFFQPNWFSFYQKLILGFIPAAILGLLFDDALEVLLQTPVVVGIMLISVGVLLVFMDKIFPQGTKEIDELSNKDAFIIGVVQSFAMIPGTSRSAATIAGAMGRKLTKKAATEFSFFLAVPTLSAAAAYKVFKNWDVLSAENLYDIAIGNLISFVTAALAVKFFIQTVQKNGFQWFGYYRIVVGSLFLVYLLC
jgi:undecaprenyl-diphosphatase